jgi:hypothetical protein
VTIRLTTGAPKSANGVSAPRRSGFQYVPLRPRVGRALREVHVTPPRADVPEQAVQGHLHAVPHRRHDVPVAEVAVAERDRHDLRALDRDAPGRDRVHRRRVRGGHVHTRMERLAAALPDPRITEESANGVLAVERPHRPRIRSHRADQPFTEDVGFDCGTGLPTFITGVFTGVLHTIVKADGSVHFTGAVRGSLTEDDLPTDGQPDATETFVLILNDLVLPPGSQVDHASLNGDGVTTGGVPFRIHEVVQVVLDQNGDPKLILTRLSCF